VGGFTKDPTALAVGTQYLQVISWNFLGNGLVFTCSAVFQGLGNTVPAVVSSATRLLSFILPALWLASQPNFALIHLWYISVASIALQAAISLWLVRGEFRRRVPLGAAPASVAA
jgi:Na+-driven multidrug efflux pump